MGLVGGVDSQRNPKRNMLSVLLFFQREREGASFRWGRAEAKRAAVAYQRCFGSSFFYFAFFFFVINLRWFFMYTHLAVYPQLAKVSGRLACMHVWPFSLSTRYAKTHTNTQQQHPATSTRTQAHQGSVTA